MANRVSQASDAALKPGNLVDGRVTRQLPSPPASDGEPLELPAFAALIVFCTLWRLPGLADPPWLNDEGVYAQVGRAIVQGEALYRQVWENKPPAIYLLFGAAQQYAGQAHVLVSVRLLALLAAIVTQSAVYGMVRTQRGAGTALLATALTGLLVDLPLLDGTEANAEIFMIALTSTGMAMLWRGISEQGSGRMLTNCCLAGAALGIAVLFKLVACADLAAATVMVLAWRGMALQERIGALLALFAGTAVPIAAIVVWLGSRGLLGEALYATVGYNRGYVSTGQSLHAPLITIASLAVPGLLIVAVASLYRRSPTRVSVGALGCLWLALGLLGALASGRSYLHYYLQAVPPLAMTVSLLLEAVAARLSNKAATSRLAFQEHRERMLREFLKKLLIAWVVIVPLGSWLALIREPPHARPGSNQAAYYGHFWLYLTGSLNETAYGNAMDPRVERNVAVATYITAHPAAPRRLYVWGNAPWIYYLSGYEHAARFLSAYYNPPIPGGMAQTLRQLLQNPPAYIVVIEPQTPADAGIAGFLRTHYVLVWRRDNARIFLLTHGGERS